LGGDLKGQHMRDHGGNLDAAIAAFGGAPDTWIDLSTGINPRGYPLPDLTPRTWAALPTQADKAALCAAARAAFDTRAAILPLSGAQAAIQLVPRLGPPGKARVLGPTYNEHAGALLASGWQVDTVAGLAALEGAELAVVVNPNNPDGQRFAPDRLRDLARTTGLLVVDESFADPEGPLSLAPHLQPDDDAIIVLRSFGKFYGLAGLRLGFTLSGAGRIAQMQAMAGPWPVSGAAIEIGIAAYADTAWQTATIARLTRDAERMDGLATQADWRVVGGTTLFRLYDTPDAAAAQSALAKAQIWTRIFPYSQSWIRLGLPDGADQWARLEQALA